MPLSGAHQRAVVMAASSLLFASVGCNAAAPKPPPESQAAPAS